MSTAVADPQAFVAQSIKKVTTIATLPEVTARIIATVEDPRSSASQLHKIVAHDPALVTRILKVVNSAFYGLPGQIASIDRAIVLLGLNAVKNIAVAASLGQLFRGVKLCDGFTARDLWTHCIGVGVAARELARQMKLPTADEAFLGGMIHDVGLLVSLQTCPEKVQQVCERAGAGGDFCEIEREIIGADHQMLGRALAEAWKFPVTCQQVAGFHHDPLALAENVARATVALVHVADRLCCTQKIGFHLTSSAQPLQPAELLQLKVDAGAVDAVSKALPELATQASSVFA